MTRAFYFSLVGNLALVAVCVALWLRETAPLPPAVAPQPFHWRQIDSADFPTFVSNLRSIGCPESIIHDIVKGEVTEIYAEKEKAVASTAAPSQARPSSRAVNPSVVQPRQTPQEIRAERDQTVAALLAPVRGIEPPAPSNERAITPAPVVSASAQPVSQIRPHIVQRSQPPVYPVFLSHELASAPSGTADSQKAGTAAGKAAAAPASAAEQATLEKIKNNFVQAVGGADQDPNDPAYLEKWQAAQEMSDAEYKKFFGGRAYVQRQIEGVRRAALEKAAAGQ